VPEKIKGTTGRRIEMDNKKVQYRKSLQQEADNRSVGLLVDAADTYFLPYDWRTPISFDSAVEAFNWGLYFTGRLKKNDNIYVVYARCAYGDEVVEAPFYFIGTYRSVLKKLKNLPEDNA
jgi:hypothetical protein